MVKLLWGPVLILLRTVLQSDPAIPEGRDREAAAAQKYNAVKNAANQKYNAAKQFGNAVKQDVQNTWQGAQRDGSMKDMQKAFNNFKMAVEKFVKNGGQLNPQMNSRISGIEKMLNSYQPNF